MAISLAVLFGCLLLATLHDPSQVRARFAWIADNLPFVLDQQTAAELATSLERLASASMVQAPAATPEPMRAAATDTGWLEMKPDAKATSQSPVAWDLDDPDTRLPVSSPWGFSISGTNVAGHALEDVQAVLKPDSTQLEMELALDVDGRAPEAGTVIPPDARFSLISATPFGDGAKQAGGAILTFRYVQAGQRKTSILYLTPAMISRLASRD
jgi:hypothetical protein